MGQAVEGVFPTAFGATIKNTAFLGLTQTYTGGSITAHARATTFENVYAEVDSAYNFNSDLNKGVLMNVQDCDFKNFVAYVDVAKDAVSASVPAAGVVSSKPSNSFTASQSAGGQGVTTSGVFSFRAYTDMYYDKINGYVRYSNTADSIGTAKTFIKNISYEEIARLFPNLLNRYAQNGTGDCVMDGVTTSFVNTGKTRSINPHPLNYSSRDDDSQGTIFTGTKGENVYTIGSSPLYVGYQFSSENGDNASLSASTLATVFVNQAPKLTNGENASINYQLVINQDKSVSEQVPETYLMSEIAGDMFAINLSDDKCSLGEIILRGKQYRHGEAAMTTLLGENKPEDVLEVRMVNLEGWYDVADAKEMATYVLAQENPFDEEFWNVSADGIVSWKNLPQA